MEILKRSKEAGRTLLDDLAQKELSRRKFLRFSGMAGASALVIGGVGLAGCSRDNDGPSGVDLGSGDVGILNYAYALEQLEAAFYTQVIATPYASISADERIFMTDIRDHEIAHREFLKAALGGNAIPGLEVDFSSINFGSRDSVLGTARAFEDLGVTAYNGAGYLFKDANYLLLAGKIVSVEARHAALIRELIAANSFLGDQVDASSVNISRSPSEVLGIAGAYIKTKINANNLPTG